MEGGNAVVISIETKERLDSCNCCKVELAESGQPTITPAQHAISLHFSGSGSNGFTMRLCNRHLREAIFDFITAKPSMALDVLVDWLGSAAMPCANKGTSCIQQQTREHERKGWHDLDPDTMCASCAAYWYMGCARNALDTVLKVQRTVR